MFVYATDTLQAWDANRLESPQVDQVCFSLSDTVLAVHKHLVCYAVSLHQLSPVSEYLHCSSGSHIGLLSPFFSLSCKETRDAT